MFKIDASEVICDIVRKYPVSPLPLRKTMSGLLFGLDVAIRDYDSESDEYGQERKIIYFIVAGGHHVWMLQSNFGPRDSWSNSPLDKWENTCNHDSCWKRDGIDWPLQHIYFTMCEKVNKEVAPISLYQSVHLCTWERVVISWKYNPDDKDRYKRVLTKIVLNP